MKNPKGHTRTWGSIAKRLFGSNTRKEEAARVAMEFATGGGGSELAPKILRGKPASNRAYHTGPESFAGDATEVADQALLYKAWTALSRIAEFREIMSVNNNGYKVHEEGDVIQFVFQLNMAFSTGVFCNMPSPISMVRVIKELRTALGEHRLKDVVIREMSSCFWSKEQVEGKTLDPFGLHACMVVILYRSNVKVADMK